MLQQGAPCLADLARCVDKLGFGAPCSILGTVLGDQGSGYPMDVHTCAIAINGDANGRIVTVQDLHMPTGRVVYDTRRRLALLIPLTSCFAIFLMKFH